MRIYRHALESILGMLDLPDLSRVLAVSREWAAAVRSMQPINASFDRTRFDPLPSIQRIVASPLLRHIAALQMCHEDTSFTPLDNASLGLLAQHAPHLQSLWCCLTLTPNEPLILPAKLTSLELQLHDEYTDAEINGLLTALAALPALSSLCLALGAFWSATTFDLSLLAGCQSLSDLSLKVLGGYRPKLSDTQVTQIRSTLGHLRRCSIGEMTPELLERLLQPPVTARWQDIGHVDADESTGELLLRLQSLTRHDIRFDWEAPMDFLPQLPQLTALSWVCPRDEGEWVIPADVLLASLLQCIGITELDLCCGFKSAHWSALFAKLTSIQKLTIRGGAMDTLRCFASAPITASLQELALDDLNLPPSELPHLYNLHRLRTLYLDKCFSSRLSDATVDSLTPPSSVLPSLRKLRYNWYKAGDGSHSVHLLRRGPSFEWMQALKQ